MTVSIIINVIMFQSSGRNNYENAVLCLSSSLVVVEPKMAQ